MSRPQPGQSPDRLPEKPLPRWFPAALPVSVLVAVLWGPVYAAVLCGVAAVAVAYATTRKPALWHLAAGTGLCATGVLAQAFAYYLILRDGSLGPHGSAAVLFLLGLQFFLHGRKVRRAAQLTLSALRRHREENGLLRAAEPLGERRPGARRVPFAMTGVFGAVVSGLGSLFLCFALLALRDLLTTGGNPWWASLVVAALFAQTVLFVGLGNTILRTAVQYYDTVVSSPDDLAGRQYVLYLRSFGDDHRLSRPHRIPLAGAWLAAAVSLGQGEEERIADALSWAGTLVGVGAPGERVPRAGARRMYLPPDDWQTPVSTMMRGATLVVIVLGKGRGTLWEIREAMRILPPERLLLLVPMKEKAYDEFRQLAGDLAPGVLPAYRRSRALSSRVRGIIHFEPDWTARFVALRRPSPLEDQLVGSLDRAMWPAMVRLTELERRADGRHGEA
ncbi:transferase [Streptomyces rubrogriseus]|uniref:Transferase n=1 Tax=Streptomyces rubrogriseus TaxID=194673 RepID=A0A6G3TR45_9ACTN|nr:transferase [Streptomyces rubrogriseus]NEC39104.1 transferase [Streptomyces rubrogriseus]